jgi:hypothetical protein
MGKPGTVVPGRRVGIIEFPPGDETMAHTYPNVVMHCVFSTKDRWDSIPASYLKDCVCTALGSVRIMTFRCFLLEGLLITSTF